MHPGVPTFHCLSVIRRTRCTLSIFRRLAHVNSYSSKTKSQTDVLLNMNGYTYSNPGCNTTSLAGTVILDPTQLTNKRLTVILDSSVDSNFVTTWNLPWTMTLLIYERSDSDLLS